MCFAWSRSPLKYAHACPKHLQRHRVQARSYEQVPAPAIAKYSFGQPRVGNLPFAADYGAACRQTPSSFALTHSILLSQCTKET